MSGFLLVHGAWQGAWIWKDVAGGLRAAGHAVFTMDLPGCGADLTPYAEVTLASCVRTLLQAAQDSGRPDLVLVGHSMGGAVVTEAASVAPELFSRLVYVCAFLPRTGESVQALSVRSHQINGAGPQPVPVEGGAAVQLSPENITESLLNGCNAERIAWATPQFRPQPLGPLVGQVTRSPGFDALEKRYIRCLEDRAIAPALQSEMAASAGIEDIREMHSGHEPFFSDPAALLQHLL